MPGGDGTGPTGQGPMTGWGRGRCGGGRGAGRGRGLGRGWGAGGRFGDAGAAVPAAPAPAAAPEGADLEALRRQVAALGRALGDLEARIGSRQGPETEERR